MADRSVVVKLRVEAAQFRSEMNSAAESAAKVGTVTEATRKQVQSPADQINRASKGVAEARRQELDATARLNTAEKNSTRSRRTTKPPPPRSPRSTPSLRRRSSRSLQSRPTRTVKPGRPQAPLCPFLVARSSASAPQRSKPASSTTRSSRLLVPQ